MFLIYIRNKKKQKTAEEAKREEESSSVVVVHNNVDIEPNRSLVVVTAHKHSRKTKREFQLGIFPIRGES